jgi:hypothetical protein
MDEETLELGTETQETETEEVETQETETEEVETQETEETEAPETQETEETPEKREEIETDKDEPELKEFQGMASARIRGLIKAHPDLGQVFKKYPALQATVEKVFRRESALSEVFPTIAEARAMREQFPNGQSDVQELLNDVAEVEELDNTFDNPGEDGTYPGHRDLIKNFFDRDRKAAVALMKTLPKEWVNLDRDSYNEVMGQVVAATFASHGVPDAIADMIEAAKEAEQPELEKGLTKLLRWVNGYFAEKPRPTDEELRLQRDRAEFDRTKQRAGKEDLVRFNREFQSTNLRLQRDIIKEHRAIQRLMTVKSIPDDKKNDIVEKIRGEMEKFLSKSPSFMRKLRPAYEKKNLQETTSIQKVAWSQPWLLNKMVRTVLYREVPQLVSSNREAANRRAGASRPGTLTKKPGVKTQTPKGPHQVGGRWFKGDGTPFTTAEILAGKHEKA